MKTDWRSEPLGKVCLIISRGISPVYRDTEGLAVLNQKCVRDHSVNFDLGRRHDANVKKVPSEKLLCVGDVLVNSTGTGTLGRVAQIREEPPEQTTVDSHVTIVRPVDNLFFPEFFGYAMVAIEEQIQEGGEGCGGQTELARSKLANDYRIGFPTDIAAQRRIVAILDEAFDGIATAKANAEKNLQNARAIFESHLQSVFTQRGNGWEIKPLGEVCERVEYGTSAKSKEQGRVPVLRMGNIQKGSFDWEKLVFTDDDAEIEKYQLRNDDVLFNRTNSPELVGKTAIFKNEQPAIFAGYLIRIHRKENLLDADYLTYFLNSKIAMDYGKTVSISSVNQANINGAKLKTYPIPIPSLKVQQAAVRVMHALRDETQHLESIYQQKLTALAELKKSLLHQAFSGAL